MAFSYSDKNFTVIGNLCFAHITVENKDASFDIPPAIANRMLIKEFMYPYPSYDNSGSNLGIARVVGSSIYCEAQYNNGYLMFYFPIDSNK